jgi:hypothetical protein
MENGGWFLEMEYGDSNNPSPRWQAVTVSENWHFQLADHDHADFHFTNGHICQDNLHLAFLDSRPQYLVEKSYSYDKLQILVKALYQF